MRIGTGCLFFDGAAPGACLAGAPADLATPTACGPDMECPPSPAQEREREARAAREAIPLWRPAPGIALR